MALFKVYHGDKSDLPGELKDSYGYIVVNEEASAGTWDDGTQTEQEYGIGEWYVDTENKRYRIAAAQLIDEDGQLYTLEDFVQKLDLVDDFVTASYDSTTQQSLLPANTQSQLRIALDVAKEDDSISKAFNITIPYTNWEEDSNRVGYYKNAVTLTEALHCGSTDAAIPVPPLIAWGGTGSKTVYDLIADADLNDNKNVITFYVKSSNYSQVSAQNISIIVIDNR